jgi:hypothetical protein
MNRRVKTRTGALRNWRIAALAILLGPALTAGGAGEMEGVETELTARGVRSLEVEGSFFRVEVMGRTGSDVEARFEIPERLLERGVRILHEQSGSLLRVWVKRPPGVLSTAGLKTPQMIFEVPAGMELRIDNSSGAVYVAGLDTGRVDIEVSSGRCEVEDVAAELDISASSGSLTVRGCDGDKTLKASSGNISVRDADGDIKANTSSGSQTYRGISGSVAAGASSGSISVKDQEGTLNLRSSSGSLLAEEVTLTGDSSFTTSSGSITVDFTNDLEDFSFDLRSSSGSIRVGGTRAQGKVVTGSGPISLRGESSSGSQSYR